MNILCGTALENLAIKAGAIIPAHYRVRGEFIYRYEIGEGVFKIPGSGYMVETKVVFAPRSEYPKNDFLEFSLVARQSFPHNRAVKIQTLQQPSDGAVYADSSDFATARFLSGRNMFIVTAQSLDGLVEIACTMQTEDFHVWAAEMAAEMAVGNRGSAAIDALGFNARQTPWSISILRDNR